jgi:predicted metal-dependent peptidase
MAGERAAGKAAGESPREKDFDLDRAIVENLKSQLYSRLRFLALPLGMLEVSFSKDVISLGLEGETLRFHPDWLRESFQSGSEELIIFILHSLYHCLLGHPWLGKIEDSGAWDLACDLMVWRLVGETYGEYLPAAYAELCGKAAKLAGPAMTAQAFCAGLETPPAPGCREQFCLDDHHLWREALEREERRQLLAGLGAGAEGGGAAEGGAAARPSRTQESLQQKWRRLGEKSLGLSSLGVPSPELPGPSGSRHREGRTGMGEGHIRRRIRLGEPKQLGYVDFLKRFTSERETAEINSDEFQYPYYLYGLRHYGNVPIIEAAESRERRGIDELAIVIDSSGSCSQELTEIFLEETRSIILSENLFFRRFKLHILQCDNAVRRDDRITSTDELAAYIRDPEIIGQGGTDFRPAFAYIENLRQQGEFARLKGLLYFTDGRGIYPTEMPDYETAFIFVKGRYDDIDTPPWALKLVFDPHVC